MMEWTDVVHGLVEEFGKDVVMVPALLEFLRVLPEEVANPKITITVSTVTSIRPRYWRSVRLAGAVRGSGLPADWSGWARWARKEADVELELAETDLALLLLLSPDPVSRDERPLWIPALLERARGPAAAVNVHRGTRSVYD